MAGGNRLIRPTWDLHDIHDNIEWDLYQDYIVEFTDISGIIIDYYRRDTTIPMDQLYGESTNTEYLTPIETRLIYDVTEEATITSNFGIYSEDHIQYAMIPRFTFERDMDNTTIAPIPGDILVTRWNNRAYEIVDTGEEEKIFQLSKMIYELILKPYRFSEQSESAKPPLIDKDETLTSPITAYGENDWIEDESDEIDDYGDVDSGVYGY